MHSLVLLLAVLDGAVGAGGEHLLSDARLLGRERLGLKGRPEHIDAAT